MRMRTFLAYFHLLNFLIMILVTIYLLNNFWGQMEDWLLAIYSYYVIVGLSGVVIAFWIAIDGKRLERYSIKIRELEKKLIAVEQKIRSIKTRTTEKSEPL
jgi:predicted membrane protein